MQNVWWCLNLQLFKALPLLNICSDPNAECFLVLTSLLQSAPLIPSAYTRPMSGLCLTQVAVLPERRPTGPRSGVNVEECVFFLSFSAEEVSLVER